MAAPQFQRGIMAPLLMMMYSVGKDSSVLLRLAQKAFALTAAGT